MTSTGYKDAVGKEIYLGSAVIIDDVEYDVITNEFNGTVVVDGETGQAPLSEVHERCLLVW